MPRKRKSGSSGSYTVNFYREECKTTHGSDISECTDDCNIVELEYEVNGSVSAYDPGRCSGPPEMCYPPEGGEVEDLSATLNGKEVDLETFTTADQEKMCELLAEAAADDDGGFDEDRYDDRDDDFEPMDFRDEP